MRLMVIVFVGSLASCDDDTRPVVQTYVAAARAGHPTKPIHADADSDAATAVLATSHDLSVDNWIVGGKTGTGCYWTSVHDASGKSIDVKFFIEREAETWKVSRVSMVKACNCPRGKRPCTMAP